MTCIMNIVIYVNSSLSCSAKHAPSLKLMFVGLSGRGKTTLLSHLKFTGKTKTLPITFRQRLETRNRKTSDSNKNGKYICRRV